MDIVLGTHCNFDMDCNYGDWNDKDHKIDTVGCWLESGVMAMSPQGWPAHSLALVNGAGCFGSERSLNQLIKVSSLSSPRIRLGTVVLKGSEQNLGINRMNW